MTNNDRTPLRLTRRGWAVVNTMGFVLYGAGIIAVNGLTSGQWGF